MRCPAKPADEVERLRTLATYGLLDTRTPNIDPIVSMAARMFECPAAAVNIIGDDHVFLSSSHGIDDYDNSREVSFCAHAINQSEVMVVEDATLDLRFHDNPIVQSGMIRFYAGVPLRTPDGHALGALCVIDSEPHAQFSADDRARLKELARLVQDRLELRRLQIAAVSDPTRFAANAVTSPNAIVCFDAQLNITAWNTSAAAMFGRAAHEVVGSSILTFIAEGDWPAV